MKLLDQLVAERAEISTAVEAVLDRAAEETRDITETEDKKFGRFDGACKGTWMPVLLIFEKFRFHTSRPQNCVPKLQLPKKQKRHPP